MVEFQIGTAWIFFVSTGILSISFSHRNPGKGAKIHISSLYQTVYQTELNHFCFALHTLKCILDTTTVKILWLGLTNETFPM